MEEIVGYFLVWLFCLVDSLNLELPKEIMNVQDSEMLS